MGATYMGFGALRRNTVRNAEDKIFGVSYAIRFSNSAPKEANFARPSENNIQMIVRAEDGADILMQFQLSRDNLQIRGYDPNVPVSAKVVVDGKYPAIDTVIKEGKSLADKMQAQKLKEITQKTLAGISIESLSRIYNELKLRRKRRR